jgi:uncharacterized phiE125 gp8 family phage protein
VSHQLLRLTRLVAPTIEPITIQEFKRHKRIDDDDGEPAPPSPGLALVSQAGNVEPGKHRYALTFITDDGETSKSPDDEQTTTAQSGKVTINLPIGGSFVTKRRVYRTIVGGSQFLLVAEINDNTTTSYEDNIADAALGAEAPTENTTDDPQLKELIQSARERVERLTGRAILQQTWEAGYDFFPGSEFKIPRPPFLLISQITYTDPDGVAQTWDQAEYDIIADLRNKAIILPKPSFSFPSTGNVNEAVQLRFTAGYPSVATVPMDLKRAMLLIAGAWYEFREDITIKKTHHLADRAMDLINPYRESNIA